MDQSRNSAGLLSELPRVREVLKFPVDQRQVALLGHDHPAALNRALAAGDIQTTHVIVLDSDCFPVSDRWLNAVDDITMASEPAYWSLSHPCFMVFPVAAAKHLDFAEGIAEVGIDTGRLCAMQLVKAGYAVSLSHPRAAFGGYRGHFYLNNAVYHHGSATFVSASDERLTRQVSTHVERRFRNAVASGRFELSLSDRIWLKVRGLNRRLRRVAARWQRQSGA